MILAWSRIPWVAVLRKEWLEHRWKVLIAVLVLPVYHLDVILTRGEVGTGAAWFFTALVGALFGADLVVFGRSAAYHDPLQVLPVKSDTVLRTRLLLGAGMIIATMTLVLGILMLLVDLRGGGVMERIDEFFGVSARPASELAVTFARITIVALVFLAVSMAVSRITGSPLPAFLVAACLAWVGAVTTGEQKDLFDNGSAGGTLHDPTTWNVAVMGAAGLVLGLPIFRVIARPFRIGLIRYVREMVPLPGTSAIFRKEVAEMSEFVLTGIVAAVLAATTGEWTLLAGIFLMLAGWLGATRVAGERDRATLDVLYALPAHPERTIREKYYAGVLVIGVLVVMAVFPSLPFLGGGGLIVIFVAVGMFMIYTLGFLISIVAPSVAQAQGVTLGISALFILTFSAPLLAIILGIVFVYLAVFAPHLWEGMRIWWPRFGVSAASTRSRRRLLVPVLFLVAAPTGYVVWSWYAFLNSDAAIVHPDRHWSSIPGLAVDVRDGQLHLITRSGDEEIRDLANPERLLQTILLKDRNVSIMARDPYAAAPVFMNERGEYVIQDFTDPYVTMQRSLHLRAREAASAPAHKGAKTKVQEVSPSHVSPATSAKVQLSIPVLPSSPIVISSNETFKIAVREWRDGSIWIPEDYSVELSTGRRPFVGPPKPVLSIVSAHGDRRTVAIMTWPEELRADRSAMYYDLGFDEKESVVYLIGPAGLTAVSVGTFLQ
jgi:ABC-type transport system involved in multi-copper enzyme maturation permease subunit